LTSTDIIWLTLTIEALRNIATGIDTIGAGVSNIPPENVIAGCGLIRIPCPATGIVAIFIYGFFARSGSMVFNGF
jgi:hypothetical protein